MDTPSSSDDLDCDGVVAVKRCPIQVPEGNEDVFQCETQMISTYVRREHRDPETRRVVKVTHAFSFCNHADLPDDMLEEAIRRRWQDLFALTGPQDSSLADKWPDRINIVHDPVPGIEELFQRNGSEDSCNYCDLSGLKSLTKYHLNKELKSEVQTDFKKDENENDFSGCTQ